MTWLTFQHSSTFPHWQPDLDTLTQTAIYNLQHLRHIINFHFSHVRSKHGIVYHPRSQSPQTWYLSSGGYHRSHFNGLAQLRVVSDDSWGCAGSGHRNRRGSGWGDESSCAKLFLVFLTFIYPNFSNFPIFHSISLIITTRRIIVKRDCADVYHR